MSRVESNAITNNCNNVDSESQINTIRQQLNSSNSFVTYRAVGGETLYQLANQIYGDSMKHTYISEANPDLRGTNLRPGQEILIPTNLGIESMEQAARLVEMRQNECYSDKDCRGERTVMPLVAVDKNENVCIGGVDSNGNCHGVEVGPLNSENTYEGIRENINTEANEDLHRLEHLLHRVNTSQNLSDEQIDDIIERLDGQEGAWSRFLHGASGRVFEFECENYIEQRQSEEPDISRQEALGEWLRNKLTELRNRGYGAY